MTFFAVGDGYENLNRVEKRLAEYKEAFEKGDYSKVESTSTSLSISLIEGLVNHIRKQEKEIEYKDKIISQLSKSVHAGHKYVWLNKNTGEFSDSWDYSKRKANSSGELALHATEGWVLIEYKDITEKGFEFMQPMRLP